ncbi:MAG: PD40 domain-containing protein [Anaerolineales bacterium]|nr:PD40 domain-containing protein [Anaerolineales bacterium]
MDDDQNQEEQKVQADNNSIAVGRISIGGDLSGNITIGNTGYTSKEVSVLITQIQTTFQPKPLDGRCPYKGLDVFEEEDAELFFGREKLVDNLVSRVKESRTVFITGPSGSGKSSLVRAGLLHALKQGAIKNSDKWLYETIKPGRNPLEALAFAFSRLKSPELGNYFSQNIHQPNVLDECTESVLSERKDQRLVLFIDQFEEIFTQVSKGITDAFLQLITNSVSKQNGRVIILFCMRSDFLPNCATYPELNTLLSQQFIQIGAMQSNELVSAIAQPALRVGLRIDPDLVAQIINDMKGEPGALPLMQFALKELFDIEQAKGGLIALALSDYLKHGGIDEALERHADNSLAKLSGHEQQLARNIFSALIEIGRGTQDTRRTALFEELIPASTSENEIEIIVQKLADARLVTTDEQAGKDTITISHEKLIDAWPWLKKLVNENREVIALQNEINSAAKEWEEHKRDISYLYTGARLLNADEQVKKQNLNLNQLAREFVKAGQARKRRSQGLLFSGFSVVLIVSIIVSVLFRNQALATQVANNEVNAQIEIAEANAEKAQKQAEIALARQLASQAQSIFNERDFRQQISVLLGIQSIKMYPTVNAAIVIKNNILTHPIANISQDGPITAVAFSPDGKYALSGSKDGTARIWEAQTGTEIARMPHDAWVYAVSFSPDGKYALSGSKDGTARVWETQTGVEIARMTHDGLVHTATFSPDGKYIVSGSDDRTARVWETQTGVEIARMTHENSVVAVSFSPDGKYVLSSSEDRTARVWEAQTGVEIARMTYESWVLTVIFSPDGKYVISGSSSGIAQVWETQTGDEIARMSHNGWVYAVAFSPGGKYVLSSGQDGLVLVWEAQTGVEIARMSNESLVHTATFSPDGRYVLSGSEDGTARVWETQTGVEIARMTHEISVAVVAFSPDGKYAISGSEDGIARVWEAQASNEIAHMSHEGSVYTVAFSPDGKYILSGGNDGTARIWKTQTGDEIARMSHNGWVYAVAFSPDGKYVLSASQDGGIRVWEAQTGIEIARMSNETNVFSFAFSLDGKYVLSGGEGGTAQVWEVQTGNKIARMTHESLVYTVAFSLDGKYAISGSEDGSIRVWEAQAGNEIAHMSHEGSVYTVAFSPNGKYAISGGKDRTARVWEAQTGNEIARITHESLVYTVAFSPDGKYVLSASQDGSVRVWEAQTGVEISRITHDGLVHTVTFSPDGKYILSGGEDGTARVWEAQTGNEIARMTHESLVFKVAFSPDGKYAISASQDASIRVWIWQTEDLIVEACSRVTRNLTKIEWKQYIGDALPYQAICENLPIEPEPATTP